MKARLAKPVDARQLLVMLGRLLGPGKSAGSQPIPTVAMSTLLAAGEVAARLQCDAGFVRELREIFREEAPDQLRLLQQSLADGEATLARRLAHSLRGGAGNVGANRLQQAAAELERALSPDVAESEAARYVRQVAEELAAVQQLLDAPAVDDAVNSGNWCRIGAL